jgi:aspartyl aminopeptidase
MTCPELGDDLAAFVDAGPSPFHAVTAMAARLEADGFTRLDETQPWQLRPGDRVYVVRDGASLVALRMGRRSPAEAGFRLIGAHTDSPGLRARPVADTTRVGYRLVGCEIYGSPLLHTWFDRDLTLAGRVALADDAGGVRLASVHLPGAPLRVPSLAVHLHRELRDEGFKPNSQQHVVPMWAEADGTERGLAQRLATELAVDAAAVTGHELIACDTQPAARGGDEGRWLFAPRLDNLASCHSGLTALLRAGPADPTAVLVANDHEEVGSVSAEGARGSFLADVLARVTAAADEHSPQAHARARSRSLLVSADTAHAVHPNYADKHEPEHRPRLGAGPVIKHNANQAYATDAPGSAWFARCAADAGASVQHFAVRGDLPCGSTIGPLTAARLGVQTVDVGQAILSMHSVREQTHVDDVAAMAATLRAHLERDGWPPTV